MTLSDVEVKLLSTLIDALSVALIAAIGVWAQKQHQTNRAIKNADARAAANHATDSLATLADNIVGKEAALAKDEAGNIVAGKLLDVETKAVAVAKNQVQDALEKELPWAQNVATSQIENAVAGAMAKLAGTHPSTLQAKVQAVANPPSPSASTSVTPQSA